MGKVLHLRPASPPDRIAAPDQHLLVDGTLSAVVTLRGAAAEQVVVDAGMAMKSPEQYLSDLVGWMALLKSGDRQ